MLLRLNYRLSTCDEVLVKGCLRLSKREQYIFADFILNLVIDGIM